MKVFRPRCSRGVSATACALHQDPSFPPVTINIHAVGFRFTGNHFTMNNVTAVKQDGEFFWIVTKEEKNNPNTLILLIQKP